MMASRLSHSLRLICHRGSELFGWLGWVGLALCTVSLVWFSNVLATHRLALPQASVSVPVAHAPTPAAALPISSNANETLAHPNEQALLLTQIQQIAVTHGLAWNAADYKLVQAGEATPATLEVRCNIKGPYPRLRAALTLWLQQVPGLAIRDLALSRPNSDVAEVEAKLQLVVFFRAEPNEARP
jgi:hypothetical protein